MTGDGQLDDFLYIQFTNIKWYEKEIFYSNFKYEEMKESHYQFPVDPVSVFCMHKIIIIEKLSKYVKALIKRLFCNGILLLVQNSTSSKYTYIVIIIMAQNPSKCGMKRWMVCKLGKGFTNNAMTHFSILGGKKLKAFAKAGVVYDEWHCCGLIKIKNITTKPNKT